jgi:CBS domain-containing membrane protein
MGLKEVLLSFIPESSSVPWAEQLRAALAAGAAILITGVTGQFYFSDPGMPWLTMSMGASAILLFAYPSSPLAQPWSFVGGHLVSAAIGIACARAIAAPAAACAIALALSIIAMLVLRCLHPAGGAVTLIAILGGEPVRSLGYQFLWLPLGLNLLLMLALALAINNLVLGHRYPAPRRHANIHQSADAPPLARTGPSAADIAASLRQLGTMVDVSPTDLGTLFEGAQTLAAQRRLGQIRVADIMSTHLATVRFDTPLEQAWTLLYTHKVHALPVIDEARHVIGIITLIDFLKAARLNRPDRLRERLRALLRADGKLDLDQARVVGQIMTSPVRTVGQQMHVMALVGMLSDAGLHHVPIVDQHNTLCGMVTQSDLIAALFEQAQRQEPGAQPGVQTSIA